MQAAHVAHRGGPAVAADPPDAVAARPQVQDPGLGAVAVRGGGSGRRRRLAARGTDASAVRPDRRIRLPRGSGGERVQEPGRADASVGGVRARRPPGSVVGAVEDGACPCEGRVHHADERDAACVDHPAARVGREQGEPGLRLGALADGRGHLGEQVDGEEPVDVAGDGREVGELVEHRPRPVRVARRRPVVRRPRRDRPDALGEPVLLPVPGFSDQRRGVTRLPRDARAQRVLDRLDIGGPRRASGRARVGHRGAGGVEVPGEQRVHAAPRRREERDAR